MKAKVKFAEFAFDNREVIHLLENRGSAIKNGNFDKMDKVEVKINNYVNNNLDKIRRPTTGYFTFEEDDCV